MPLAKPADHGVEADGTRNEELCVHCYQDGSYTDPNLTLDQMVEIVADSCRSPVTRLPGPPEKAWPALRCGARLGKIMGLSGIYL